MNSISKLCLLSAVIPWTLDASANPELQIPLNPSTSEISPAKHSDSRRIDATGLATPGSNMHYLIQSLVTGTSIDYPVPFTITLRSPEMDVAFDNPEQAAAYLLNAPSPSRGKSSEFDHNVENLPGDDLIPVPNYDGGYIGARSSGCDLLRPTVGSPVFAKWEWRWGYYEDTNLDGLVDDNDTPGWHLLQVDFRSLFGEADELCS